MADDVDDADLQAAFSGGYAGVKANGKAPPEKAPSEKAAEAKEPPVATPQAEPEHVQITKKDWDEIKAAASRTASYDAQFSKIFGTLGNVTKQLASSKAQPEEAPPAAPRVEISAKAFAEMEQEYPELARMNRAALGEALTELGLGARDVDNSKIESIVETVAAKRDALREIAALDRAFPDWRTIVGAVDATQQQPDPNNPYRKWLATKPQDYQDYMNASESAAEISDSIRLFRKETTKPAPRNDQARAARIAAAVQPRGDNAGATAGRTEQEEFMAGYRSARGIR